MTDAATELKLVSAGESAPLADGETESHRAQDSDLEIAAARALTEDVALALLTRKQISSEAIEQLSKHTNLLNSRKVRMALVIHPRTTRRIALRLLRQFYTFDLMHIALSPTLAGDLKRAADELLVSRIASVTFGERITLARRGSTTVAASLLLDKEPRVLQTALANPRLTEAAIIKAISLPTTPPGLVAVLCRHSKWSARREIRIALLRNPKTPLARALEYARSLHAATVRDILHNSQLSARVKSYLRKELEAQS